MAQIHEELIAIRFSKLIKPDTETPSLVTPELMATLEAVAQEVVDSNVVVEIIQN